MKSPLLFLFFFTSLYGYTMTLLPFPVTDSCNHRLYFTVPATIWEKAFPLGRGRLGMMLDGGIQSEHIVFNGISLWSGMEADYSCPKAAKNLPKIRRLLLEGMLLKSHENFIHLLSALPDSWHEDSLRGMCVRGGAFLSLDWKNGRAVKSVVEASVLERFILKMTSGVTRGEVLIAQQRDTYDFPTFKQDLKLGEISQIGTF